MRVLLQPGRLVLVPEGEAEERALSGWKATQAGHVLHATPTRGTGQAFLDLGPRPDACREPINIGSRVADSALRLISNFAEAPYFLDGRHYASVEGFWQGLKFAGEADRARVAALIGRDALRAGREQGYGATITYKGQTIVVGTWEHWQLMERACRAKFEQNLAAREALLGTGERPLEHRMRRDSKAIPGVVMADIWMRIRADLRA